MRDRDLRAKRKGGQMLQSLEKQTGGDARRASLGSKSEPSKPVPPKLSEVGVTKKESHQWQDVASGQSWR
ncbi:MAG: hypothetical protein ACREAA_07135 [Candidatus Polarisedimenticolia bacterium]